MTDAVFTDVSGRVRLVGSLTGATAEADAPQWAVRTLTAAEILALETTPVTLVAAPGAGKWIAPLFHAVHYRPGATPYAGDSSHLTTGYGSSVAAVLAAAYCDALVTGGTGIVGTDFLAAATDAYSQTPTPLSLHAYLTAAIVNKPYALITDDGIGFSNGDGTLTVSVLYAVLTAATT